MWSVHHPGNNCPITLWLGSSAMAYPYHPGYLMHTTCSLLFIRKMNGSGWKYYTSFLVSQERRHQSVSILLFCNTFKQLYLKDKREPHSFQYIMRIAYFFLRRNAHKQISFRFWTLTPYFGAPFEKKTRHLGEKTPAGIS